MHYRIDSLKFREFIENVNKIIDTMNKEINIMDEISKKPIWEGMAHDSTMLKYNNILDDVKKIPQNLNLYINFMKLVIENYGNGNQLIKKEFQNIMDKLSLENLNNER